MKLGAHFLPEHFPTFVDSVGAAERAGYERAWLVDGPTMHVSVKLRDGRDNTVLLDRSYNEPVEHGIRTVLDAITKDVAMALAVKLDVETLAQDQGGTNSLAAADLYWKWRQFVLQDGPAATNLQ